MLGCRLLLNPSSFREPESALLGIECVPFLLPLIEFESDNKKKIKSKVTEQFVFHRLFCSTR